MSRPSSFDDPAAAFPDAFVGPSFYKLGYVTSDRTAAIDHFTERLGFEKFVTFSPRFEAVMSDGRRGWAALDCAFSAGRQIVIELMQPVSGLCDLWSDRLPDRGGTAIVFHHFGHLTDDLAAITRNAAARGIQAELTAEVPPHITFAYFELPGVGHYLEHIQYRGGSESFLESVRGAELPPTPAPTNSG